MAGSRTLAWPSQLGTSAVPGIRALLPFPRNTSILLAEPPWCDTMAGSHTNTKHMGTRKKSRNKLVALGGYTNAGKSTLFNKLTKSEQIAEDKLFATVVTLALFAAKLDNPEIPASVLMFELFELTALILAELELTADTAALILSLIHI